MRSKMLQRKYYLICYDIENTKKRNKLAKWLLNYGIRVQKSVFEAYLSERDLEEMMQGAKPFIENGDSLRVYELTSEAYRNKRVIGEQLDYLPWENVII
jgi:CRISPR-associated protein Cas2